MARMLDLRRAILSACKADAGVTALVASADIHPQAPLLTPSWPFIRFGAPVGVPLRASCVNGLVVTFMMHGFTKPLYTGDALTESAEDRAHRINAALIGALDGAMLIVPGGHAKVKATQETVIPDRDTADAFHGITEYRARLFV